MIFGGVNTFCFLRLYTEKLDPLNFPPGELPVVDTKFKLALYRRGFSALVWCRVRAAVGTFTSSTQGLMQIVFMKPESESVLQRGDDTNPKPPPASKGFFEREAGHISACSLIKRSHSAGGELSLRTRGSLQPLIGVNDGAPEQQRCPSGAHTADQEVR